MKLTVVVAYVLTFVISLIMGSIFYHLIVCFFISLKRAWKNEHINTKAPIALRNHIIGLIIMVSALFIILINHPTFKGLDIFEIITGLIIYGFFLWLILVTLIDLMHKKQKKRKEQKQATALALAYNNKNVAECICFGRVFIKSGSYYDAIEAFNYAIQIDPKNVEAWESIGNIYYRLESKFEFGRSVPHYAEAIEAFNQVVGRSRYAAENISN